MTSVRRKRGLSGHWTQRQGEGVRQYSVPGGDSGGSSKVVGCGKSVSGSGIWHLVGLALAFAIAIGVWQRGWHRRAAVYKIATVVTRVAAATRRHAMLASFLR